jgi:hypothetical protein
VVIAGPYGYGLGRDLVEDQESVVQRSLQEA